MASDSSGMIWMAASGTQPNVLVVFKMDTEEFFGATPVPSGGGTVRHLKYYKPSGTIWFGTDSNQP